MARKTTKKITKSKVAKSSKDVKQVSNKKLSLSNKMEMLTDKVNSLKSKRFFALFFILLILILLLYAAKGVLFAAMVGGRPISRITLIKELEKRGGRDALENLITKEIIAQESQKKRVVVSDTDIKTEVDRIRGIVEGQGTTLEVALESQGQSMADLEENIKIQKTLERLLADKLAVSDEEVQKYFDENKEIYGVDAKFEDVRDSIKDQLIQTKLSTEFDSYLAALRAEKKVIYFVDFE